MGGFLPLLRPHLESMGMRHSGARGDLSEARTRRVGPPRPKEHKVPGTFRSNRPGHKGFVSRRRTDDDIGGCEEGWASREGSIAEG